MPEQTAELADLLLLPLRRSRCASIYGGHVARSTSGAHIQKLWNAIS
jgi:hypothetical protein